MLFEQFYIKNLRQLFDNEGFNNFESLWSYSGKWVEPINERRGGWSGVCRLEIPDTSVPHFFLKRQENHNTKSFRHPFKGIPTYRREVNNILRFKKYNIATLDLAYYGERKHQNKHQAILISRALEDFEPLEEWIAKANESQLNEMLKKLAHTIRHMHSHGLMHMYLNSSSIFVRKTKKSLLERSIIDIRIIDLESVRIQPISMKRRFKDLRYMLEHIHALSHQNFVYFLELYFNSKPNFFGADTLHSRLSTHLDRLARK
ncbi:MAG: lipopolysaccharide kinase InaA family protein [Pseudomonadota bacterium]